MSMDGTSHPCLSSPLVSCPFHTRGLSSQSWLLARASNITTATFNQAISFQCQPRFCTPLAGIRDYHAVLLQLSFGSASYGIGLSRSIPLRNEFCVCSKRRNPCVQQLNSYKCDQSLDLESQILDFMHQSDSSDLFPSRTELMRAGRSDLVEAILAKGGWMVAGWDLESSIEDEAERLDSFGINSIAKAPGEHHIGTLNETGEEHQNRQPAFPGEAPSLLVEGIDMSQCHYAISTLERQKGWEKVADLFGLSSTIKPEHDEKPLVLANQEIPRTQPRNLNGASAHVHQCDHFDSRRRDNARQSVEGDNSGVIGKKKRRRRKSTKRSTAGSNVQDISSQAYHDAQITQSKARDMKPDDSQPEENNVPISHRIRGLEAELVSTLDVLKSGRHTLIVDIKSKQKQHCRELEEVSDALEFCETEIMNKKRELRTARAQQTAFEGKLALDLMEFRRSLEEKDQRLEQAMQVLKTLRTARIVWPNPASEVFLAGSYDGWASWRRMEKSNAGVFATTLQLYPGQYEIKFIVDGAWRVDPNRARTFASGYENNVLTVV